jgi:hypothetical protein
MINNTEPQRLSAIINEFTIVGQPLSAVPFGSGHINDTYLVRTDGEGPDYLLQRINHVVFKDQDQLMSNILLVTNHLRKKIQQRVPDNPEGSIRTVLTPVVCKNGKWYYREPSGNVWRVYHYIPDSRSYDMVETPRQAREGGRAFGEFQAMLTDLDASLIHEVIPDFHHIGKRLEKLHQAVAADAVGRKADAAAEIAFIARREAAMHRILEMGATGALPRRIIHYDTKFNNVLLDGHDQVKCVIDLDTVMPGYVAYDFGDAIRTIINSAAEDEADLSKITLNIPLFEAYAQGYFEKAASFLTPEEIDSLLYGAFLLPYMQAVRFLTDYLEGDVYYKTAHAAHNLQRTRAQLKLVSEMEQHEHELKEILATITQKIHP